MSIFILGYDTENNKNIDTINTHTQKTALMSAVDLKALPWRHIDPSSVIWGPEI